MGIKKEEDDDDDDNDNSVKVETTSEGYEMINPFVGDDIKVDDIKFNKLAMAETVDEEVEPMLTIPPRKPGQSIIPIAN